MMCSTCAGWTGQRVCPPDKWECSVERGGCSFFNDKAQFYCDMCNRARPDLGTVRFLDAGLCARERTWRREGPSLALPPERSTPVFHVGPFGRYPGGDTSHRARALVVPLMRRSRTGTYHWCCEYERELTLSAENADEISYVASAAARPFAASLQYPRVGHISGTRLSSTAPCHTAGTESRVELLAAEVRVVRGTQTIKSNCERSFGLIWAKPMQG